MCFLFASLPIERNKHIFLGRWHSKLIQQLRFKLLADKLCFCHRDEFCGTWIQRIKNDHNAIIFQAGQGRYPKLFYLYNISHWELSARPSFTNNVMSELCHGKYIVYYFKLSMLCVVSCICIVSMQDVYNWHYSTYFEGKSKSKGHGLQGLVMCRRQRDQSSANPPDLGM